MLLLTDALHPQNSLYVPQQQPLAIMFPDGLTILGGGTWVWRDSSPVSTLYAMIPESISAPRFFLSSAKILFDGRMLHSKVVLMSDRLIEYSLFSTTKYSFPLRY